MGKAVVSTTVGAEGLPVTSGETAMIADDPRTFADATVDLLRNSQRRRQLETSARALVVERYDWSAVAGELEAALVRVALRQAEGGREVSVTARAEPVGARATGHAS